MHMKKVLFILFSFLVLAGSVNAQFVSGNTQIMLMQKDGDRDPPGQIGDTSPENAPQTRGVILQPVCASLYNKVVTVDFQTAFSAVTVNVINETTGETVYSELFINPASFSIDLSGKGTGDYMIEITSDEITLEGYFPL
ncbi:protein of unknown function [Bacteroides stercorirosoris]|jgi:hypothetical protein|uniref:DUF3244 domain-containing protein n=2 Tax=Bacteroides stercorirosoris TaxID=871324 RepID=A0A1M6D1N3_9BACE|nr:protein of unknown function [Bacteroides stercorirosoris]